MKYEISVKHFDSPLANQLSERWIEHGYSTLGGMFALRALPHWEVTTTLENNYVVLKIQGTGTREDALTMVGKVIVEQNATIPGLCLVLHESRT